MCPDTSLGRLAGSMCIAAGFQPRVAAKVHDVGTAISLVAMGGASPLLPSSPRLAAAISAVRSVSADLPAGNPSRAIAR